MEKEYFILVPFEGGHALYVHQSGENGLLSTVHTLCLYFFTWVLISTTNLYNLFRGCLVILKNGLIILKPVFHHFRVTLSMKNVDILYSQLPEKLCVMVFATACIKAWGNWPLGNIGSSSLNMVYALMYLGLLLYFSAEFQNVLHKISYIFYLCVLFCFGSFVFYLQVDNSMCIKYIEMWVCKYMCV